MVLRSVVRNRVRTTIGIFAAMMGACVMVSGFMMAQATYYLVDFQFRWILRSDIDLSFKDEHGEDGLLEAARLPGVDRAEPMLNVSCKFRNGPYEKKGVITGLASNAQLTVPRDRQARPIRIPPFGLTMTSKMAELLHLKRGDLVRVQAIKGLRREHLVPVVQIAESYIGTAVYADLGWLSRLVSEEMAVSGVQLALDGNPDHRASLYRELKELPALQAADSRSDMIQAIEDTLVRNLWVVISLLVIFAGIIFFGSILNASLVSLAERSREVATLRVLGYTPWQVGSMLLRESLSATMLGTLLGLPGGYYLSVAISAMYDSEMFRFPVVWTTGTWVGTLAMAFLFALAAHVFVQVAIYRMNWREALQAKE
jgi:putative ABC transport system permease protein